MRPVLILGLLSALCFSSEVEFSDPSFHLDSLNNIVYYKPDDSLSKAPIAGLTDSEDNLHILNTASYGPPTMKIAAIHARTLVTRESIVTVNTVIQSDSQQGVPVSFAEYYADCGDGNPIILGLDSSPTFKNIEMGSPVSLSIRVGDHWGEEHVNPKYPGSRPQSLHGSPRISLRGRFVQVSAEDVEEVQECFMKKHADAQWWAPGNPIHTSKWLRFVVEDVYYIAGFADTGYVGEIPGELYSRSGTLDGFNMLGRVDPQAEYWENEISNYEQEFGEHSTLALVTSTLLGRLRRLSMFYDKASKKEDLTDKFVVKPGVGLHAGGMYQTIIQALNLRKGAQSSKRSLLKDDEYEERLKLNRLSPEQFQQIIEALQRRIEEVKEYTDGFISSHSAAESRDSTPSVVVYQEAPDQEIIPDYVPHPHDKFHAKELRENGGWSVAKSEDIYLAHHPGGQVPDNAKNKLMVFRDD